MGARGFQPKPTELKILTGGRVNKRAPQPVSREVGSPPDWLDDIAREKWHELSTRLGSMGVLAETDAGILTMYAQTWSIWRRASDLVQDEGLTVPSAAGSAKTNPAVHVASDAVKTLTRLGVELGQSPSSRGSIRATTPPTTSKLAKFLVDAHSPRKESRQNKLSDLRTVRRHFLR